MLIRPAGTDYRVIAFFLGRICMVLAGASLLPIAWALVGREWAPLSSFVLMAGVFTAFGAAGSAIRVPEERLDWSQGMVVVAVAWLIVPIIGAIPMVLSGHFGDPLDAVFDAVSGLTTTGLSVMQDLDHLAPSLNFWRHLLQFLGGQGIILAALSLFAGGAGMSLYYGEARDEKIFPSVASTARFMWAVSLVHLVFGVAVLALIGMFLVGFDPIRALFHGLLMFFAAFSTGGFSPQSTSLGYYRSPWFEMATGVLMVAGATSFGAHFLLWRRKGVRVLRHIETRTILVTFAITLGVTIVGLGAAGVFTGILGLTRQGLVHALSAQTTTGFSTISSGELHTWSGLAYAGVVAAMALGGMASSTAGGVKALRVGLTLRVVRDQVRQVLLPSRAVLPQTYDQGGRRALTPGLAQSVLTVTLLYVALYFLGAAVGIAHGASLHAAMFESVSASATVGLSVGLTDPGMPVALQSTYMLQMWMGRLEFVAVFVLAGFLWSAVRGR